MDCKRRLSVIVPGYNTPKEWWVRCIASIARALTSEDEIIIVDDGSKIPVEKSWFDSILHLHLESTPIHIIRHAKNLGLPSGRNSGLDAAQGRFVTFVDSDDEVREEAYSRTIVALEKYDADLAVYGVQSINVGDRYTVKDLPEDKFWGALTPRDVASLVKRRLFYYSWNKVFRRSFVDEHNLRFNPEGVPCEDAIFNVACVVHKAKWVTVGYLGYIYYRYDGSLLSSYKPTLVQGIRACTKTWHDYKASIPGAVEQMEEYGLGWYDERSEEEIARNQWLNIWRRRSPYGIRGKWAWLKENEKLMGCEGTVARLIEFVKQAARMFVRTYLYIGPIRRRHQIGFVTRIGAKMEPLSKDNKRRLIFAMNIPSPYRLHTFNLLWEACKKRNVDLMVHFMNRTHKDRPKSWLNPKIDFPHRYWRNYGTDQHELNPGLAWKLIFTKGAWIHLGSSFDTFTGILVALFCRHSTLCAGCEGNTKTPGEIHGLRGWVKRKVFSKCQYVSVAGQEGVRFIALHQSLTKLQMPTPISLPNLVDESRFKVRGEYPAEEILACRTRMGALENDRICLIPARFVWEKGLVPFFKLVEPEMLKGWHVVIMGHGPLQAEVEAVLQERGTSPYVTIIESLPYEQMPLYYAAADLMLLPSVYDQNPLTVIEALHCGLPLALSDMAGNVDEAVNEGKNGWVLPVTKPAELTAKLREVFSSNLDSLRTKGRYSKEVTSQFWNSEKAIAHYLDKVIGLTA